MLEEISIYWVIVALLAAFMAVVIMYVNMKTAVVDKSPEAEADRMHDGSDGWANEFGLSDSHGSSDGGDGD